MLPISPEWTCLELEDGLELVSTSPTRPNGDNLRLVTLGAWPVASVSSDAIPFTNPIARTR
jgi:hypothetical protein